MQFQCSLVNSLIDCIPFLTGVLIFLSLLFFLLNLPLPKVNNIALTNANRLLLQIVPWNRHSAFVLSTLALLVALEVEICCPTKNTSLIHLIPAVPRHQLALWVVPPY